MAVIIDINHNGQMIYKSLGFINDDEKQKAQELNVFIKSEVNKIEEELMHAGLLKNNKGNNQTWWELGSKLNQRIIDKDGLVQPREKKWLRKAVRIHASDKIIKADRGKRRDHLRNCCRYGKLPRKKALALNWSEWSYLFDSSSFMSDNRADLWLERNLDSLITLTRTEFRKMVQFFNNEVGKKRKIDFSIFTDEEFQELWDKKLNEYLEKIGGD